MCGTICIWQVLLRSLPIIAQHELKYHNRLYSIGSRAPVTMKSNKPVIHFTQFCLNITVMYMWAFIWLAAQSGWPVPFCIILGCLLGAHGSFTNVLKGSLMCFFVMQHASSPGTQSNDNAPGKHASIAQF